MSHSKAGVFVESIAGCLTTPLRIPPPLIIPVELAVDLFYLPLGLENEAPLPSVFVPVLGVGLHVRVTSLKLFEVLPVIHELRVRPDNRVLASGGICDFIP